MDTRDLKTSVKSAAGYLAEHGFDVPHTRLLEAMSRALGERNWATLRARLEAPAVGATANPATPAVADWAPGQEPMTDAQFVRYGGSRCPFCGGHELESAEVEADGPNAWDETSCSDCGSTWSTAYKVCGYFDAQRGSGLGEAQAMPAAPTPALAAILTTLDETQGLVLVARSEDHSELLATVYPARQALAILAAELDEPEAISTLEDLLKVVSSDEEVAVDQLANKRLRPVVTEVSTSASLARNAAVSAAAREGVEVLGISQVTPCPFELDDVLLFTYLDGASLKHKGLAYHALAAWDCLAEFIGDVSGRTAAELAQAFYEASDGCIEALQTARVLPLFACEYASAARCYREVREEIHQRGRRPVDVYREDVVEELVDHVTRMSRKYQWRTSSLENAFDMACESAEALQLDATTAELVQAALRLS